MPKITRNDIDEADDRLETMRRNYLREHGWEATSATPGSLWLWQRKLPDGRVALVDESSAIYMQGYWDKT